MTVDVEAARVINTVTKTHIDIPAEAKEVNMCKAIEDLISDSKAESRIEGINQGMHGSCSCMKQFDCLRNYCMLR